MSPEAIRKVNIIGHLNPDTDSICSAIAYAYLKNQIDGSGTGYEARRAGAINRETSFALKHFDFEEPRLITSVAPQIKDIEITPLQGISRETSLHVAWNLMRDTDAGTLCVVDNDGDLQGLIAVKDIANANMDILDTFVLSKSRTLYQNILDTLDAHMIVGNPHAAIEKGKLSIGTTPEMMDGNISPGDIILVTNRYESQRFALEAGAGCLIVCCGANVTSVIRNLAEERGCTIIATPHDTYAASRLITMSIPVRAKMITEEHIQAFSLNTSIEEAQRVIARTQHRVFPVLGEDGSYAGVVSSTNMMRVDKKHVILVDHAELSQMVDGIREAEIMEVIDHHRVGTLETPGPIYYRCEPVGCTCTIIYEMFQEYEVEIPPKIAGLMMSAILSDTLCFRSPTCTATDAEVGRRLAQICGEDPEEYSDAMFDAGSDLEGRTADEVFNSDFKIFSRGDVNFGVGQGSFMTKKSRKACEKLLTPYFPAAAKAKDLPTLFFMFTDIRSQSTEMLYWGASAEEILKRAFTTKPKNGRVMLPGIVSRKKQVIPALMNAIERFQDEQK
ncbi:MAG: putative manganese-dependent inorganic diphosphatase [Coriobacteriales bacterium]|nr:putative manganese-dependent inorganic diphosphatase [Coriobacteriales bacterium]